MQLLSAPDLKAVAWTPPASSAGIHFKENLDGEIDSAGAVTHQDVAAISGLVADFVSLAESVLTLADSEETRQPDQDGDGKASSSLTKLRELKADAERTLERSAMMLGAPAESSKKLNLIDGGLEMRLVFLSVELSTVIDEVLKGRLQAQKDRNTQIQNLNELMNGLRKLQKSKEDFTAADLEKAFKSLPPDSPILKKSIEKARKIWEQGQAEADASERAACGEIIAWELKHSSAFKKEYDNVNRIMDVEYYAADDAEFIRCWGNRKSDGTRECIKIEVRGNFWYPRWAIDEVYRVYIAKDVAYGRCRKVYENLAALNGKASLSDLLYAYGIYKDGEKLPATKEELEAATEKISAMVSSINSTQTLKMLEIDKFTNGRNEAFNLAVKVNNSKVDNLNSIIRQIGERQ